MIDFQNGTLFKLKKVDYKEFTDYARLLLPDEKVISVYKTVRDHVVFTTLRIIAVNVQGLTGTKKDFSILPYSKIQAFSIETAGTFDLDSELELYFSALGKVRFEFTGSSDIVRIGQAISTFLL